MPKQKPCKGLRKRVRVTKTGKVVSVSCGSGHRKVVKGAKKNLKLTRIRVISPIAAKQIKRLLGYK